MNIYGFKLPFVVVAAEGAKWQLFLNALAAAMTGCDEWWTNLDASRSNVIMIRTRYRVDLTAAAAALPTNAECYCTCYDSSQTQQQYLIDRPYVQKGDTIFACSTVPLSSELSDEFRIPFTLSLATYDSIIIGTANRSAEDGIYATPFSTAEAHTIVGGDVAFLQNVIAPAEANRARAAFDNVATRLIGPARG